MYEVVIYTINEIKFVKVEGDKIAIVELTFGT